MEIGIDIEQNSRFLNLTEKFINRAYTKREVEVAKSFKNYHEIFCSYWCVKESVVKAFSNRKLNFQDIEIANTEEGRPFIIKNAVRIFNCCST